MTPPSRPGGAAGDPQSALTSLANGAATRMAVRAQPGARRSGIVGLWNGQLKVALRSAPQDGHANSELVELLARALGLRPAEVRLVRGERSRGKLLELDLAPGAVRARLLPLLAAAG